MTKKMALALFDAYSDIQQDGLFTDVDRAKRVMKLSPKPFPKFASAAKSDSAIKENKRMKSNSSPNMRVAVEKILLSVEKAVLALIGKA
mmetsp:Transcript_21150/g.44072  ORF Transcript_21150/g.44072 Transcript_21150/m.44072 type:complete len:89 (-) Transcript_21150:631-897(-)